RSVLLPGCRLLQGTLLQLGRFSIPQLHRVEDLPRKLHVRLCHTRVELARLGQLQRAGQLRLGNLEPDPLDTRLELEVDESLASKSPCSGGLGGKHSGLVLLAAGLESRNLLRLLVALGLQGRRLEGNPSRQRASLFELRLP